MKTKKHNWKRWLPLYLMMAPGLIYIFINNYIPMFGTIIAFKHINYQKGILGSDWVGLKNFKFLFATNDAWVITRNTLLYNLAFIVINTVVGIILAIFICDVVSKKLKKLYQSAVLLPYLMSIVIITGDDEYLQKELFKGYIRTVASEEQIPITEKRKWFVQDVQGTLFLTTTFCLKNNYVGCWIRPEKICASFRKTQEDTLSFFIRDLSTGVHYLENSSASGSMFQKNENIQENSSSHYWEYEFENANVSIGIDVSDKIKKSAGTYEILMAITTVLICFMCIGAFYYFRHYVQKPLYIFEENLRKFQETGELEQNNYYEEFENVGEIWRNLEKEIQELKVQVYEEQLEKQKTKIDYLQLQIRPHFYINCLNSIYSMAQLKHTEEIQQLALYVSGYMRSIFRKGTKPILMDEELQQIVNYVKIHNILYRYDCKCHICVDERVKQAMIPPLIMIVFVENCVKYTVGSKRKIEISIEGSFLDEEQKKIQIRIADNGPGFPENVLEKFRKNEFGANDDRFQIGIRNTKDRLQLLYGAEASLMIGNGENLGTEVIIIIPYQNGDEKSEYSISR